MKAIASLLVLSFCLQAAAQNSWIRINQLGYRPHNSKVAVWCSKEKNTAATFSLIDARNDKVVFKAAVGKAFGPYGPFTQTARLNFSSFKKEGIYFLQMGSIRSPQFVIHDTVYKGAADFCLQYLRQQRSGFNPFLKDSCHTQDGYVLYGSAAGLQDSSFVDVTGGWHDASDYLQYSSTSANSTYHLLMAYRDYPNVFTDKHQSNGLAGANGLPDVLDEARWGLQWLSKMHPQPHLLFNQIADDRDHQGMRLPKLDSFYGRGHQRPVYLVTGEPQQRGKFVNNTTGTSSTAAKFSSAFALGKEVFEPIDSGFSQKLAWKAASSFLYAYNKLGVTQTASVRSPYIYAEDNWTDDMELMYAALKRISKDEPDHQALEDHNKKTTATLHQHTLDSAFAYAQKEKWTPWLGSDTARHYQWYPFINIGHYELARQLTGKRKDSIIGYYKTGIEKVWAKANENAFYRGVPFIWCSNNLTVAFAMQCMWYRHLSGDARFEELETANFDWLFGCNPWGTSMVYGLPAHGDTPVDPHSAFTHLNNYPINGGLVDGPVYGSIYNNLIGITIYQPDEYAAFQSSLAVYHDDYGDYATNEPTLDGTAALIYLLAARTAPSGGG